MPILHGSTVPGIKIIYPDGHFGFDPILFAKMYMGCNITSSVPVSAIDESRPQCKIAGRRIGYLK